MIIVGFAGPGGVCEGLRSIGLDSVGVEWDPAACATRAAAGHRTIRADATTFPLNHIGDVDGLVMTPPCQAFSSAGKGDGRVELVRLRSSIDRGRWDARSAGSEVLQVGRWAETLRPRWIMCEQVPPVLPLWEAYAHRWRALFGWSCWAGTLLAADYGVPQTRLRAFLLARADGRPARPPEPTHCERGADTLFGGLLPWVSMAEALGWGLPAQPSPTVMTARNRQTGHDVLRGSSWRHEWFQRQQAAGNWTLRAGAQPNAAVRAIDEPAPTVLGSWDNGDTRWQLNSRQQHDGTPVRNIPDDEPAPTLTGTAGAKSQWVWERPATTVCGDPRLSFPGHHDAEHRSNSIDDGAVKLTLAEALILQGFPPDYPVQGTKTERFRQVGDAVCPPLAAAIIRELTR